MSVATAGAAVSTQHPQPTQEQIRLAQLIDDKKHNQPEVQEIIRKVLDVVEDSNQEDALVALFDCDYDYEKAVALLIEKGHDVASEWRTATNHKLTKKQQQKIAATKNGHDELNENGQQRGNNTSTSRNKSRGGRSRFQQNGGDSQNNTKNNNQQQQQQQQNDNDMPQQRQRGGNGNRGRYRGNQRGGFRGTDRNFHQQQQQPQQQQIQDANIDTSSPSDTNRRSKGTASNSRQQQEQWDVGNWNGETLIISRTHKDEETLTSSDKPSTVQNGQSDVTNPDQPKPKFDPIEAARQIKDVIGIGQAPKSSISDQQQKSKPTGQQLNTKVTPSPQSAVPIQQRIPHQPVIFSDHFDGGVNKIDVQFGNLGESYDDPSAAAAAAVAFYQQTELIPSNKLSQQRPTEQSAHISPSTRSLEQPVMNQQRMLLTQLQPSNITMKPVVAPQYAVHPQQHQANTPNILMQSLLYHQQQPEPVTLDASYDPNTFPLSSLEFNSPYFMPAPMNVPPPQQQTQPRFLVPQPALAPQQTGIKNAQTPSVSTSTSSTGAKKAPAVPPGMFPSTAPPPTLAQAAYSAPYGVQQQAGGPAFAAPYDADHLFTNSFIQLTNPQQTQSPTGGYGSVTPPVQQQNQPQQANNNNDNKAMSFQGPMTENLMLIQRLTLQQTNSQPHGQQAAAHSPMSYFLGHPPSGSNYSPGPQIMYAPAAAAAAMTQQQQFPKQQGQQYNQHNSSANIGGNEDYYGRNSSSSNKEAQYMYATATQPSHISSQSAGQQQGVNKQQQQQQQRTGGNVYNNHHQQGQQRPYQ